MTSFKQKTLFACAFLLVVDVAVYLLTLAPAVQFMDSGELAAACATLGITHPTGYPLYTLIGRIFTLLPFGDVVFRLNLLSLLFACLTNLVLLLIILKTVRVQSEKALWAAFLSSLIFSFTPVLWSQATSNEVYSFSIFLLSLVIILTLIQGEGLKRPMGSKGFYLLAFVYGLSLGHHMMALLLLPAILFLLLSYGGKALFRPHRMFLAAALFIMGLSIYLYLPIRSAHNPPFDWGNPETWSALKIHISGQHYRAWIFTLSAEKLASSLHNFVVIFFKQFPFYLLPFTFLGIWRLFVRDSKILVFLLILFFAYIIYGINYKISDIEPYFLGSFFVNAVFLGNGFLFAFEKLEKIKLHRPITLGVICLFALIPVVSVARNYHKQDKSSNYLAYDLGCNLLRSIRKDGLFISSVWHHDSVLLYLMHVEGKRPDLVAISERLSLYPWYFETVKRNYPAICQTSRGLIESYVGDVRRCERGGPCDLNLIRQKHLSLLNSFLLRSADQRPIYDDLTGNQELGKTFVRIPEGLVYCLKDTFEYYPYDFPDYELRGVRDETVYLDERTRVYLSPYVFMTEQRIDYLLSFGLEEEARKLREKYRDILAR